MTGESPPILSSGERLFGREREREVVDRLLAGIHNGRSGVLVVHGEAGVGKTALLEYAVEAAPGYRIARTVGVEAEMELPFAAAQQLCSPFLDLSERLPQPQHDALDVAFGLSDGIRAGSIPGRSGGPRPAGRSRRGAATRCVPLTTRSGSTVRPRGPWPLWRVVS